MKGKKRQRIKKLDFQFDDDLPNGMTNKKYIPARKKVSFFVDGTELTMKFHCRHMVHGTYSRDI